MMYSTASYPPVRPPYVRVPVQPQPHHPLAPGMTDPDERPLADALHTIDPGPWFSIDDLVARKWSGSTMKAHLRPYLPAARIVGAKDFYDTLWSRALIRSIERRCLATRDRGEYANTKELEQRFVTGRRVYQPGDPDVVVTNPTSQA